MIWSDRRVKADLSTYPKVSDKIQVLGVADVTPLRSVVLAWQRPWALPEHVRAKNANMAARAGFNEQPLESRWWVKFSFPPNSNQDIVIKEALLHGPGFKATTYNSKMYFFFKFYFHSSRTHLEFSDELLRYGSVRHTQKSSLNLLKIAQDKEVEQGQPQALEF